MANQEKSKFAKGWDKVITWYAKQAYAVGIVYSLGASVVIIGALFKILHWPGASQVLMVGMFTEAFLFILGIFEKPHAAYHWENVFPQLIGHEQKELLGGNGIVGGSPASQTGTSASVPAISEESLKSLQEGIDNLGKTAEQLATLGNVATATNSLVEKMNTASVAAESFANTQTALSNATRTLGQSYQTISADMDAIVKQTQNYGKGMEAVNAQMASLNSVYELQLKDLQAQSAAFKNQTGSVDKITSVIEAMTADAKTMQQNNAAALEATALYLAAQQKLAAQVADLNKVYGNMLNALG